MPPSLRMEQRVAQTQTQRLVMTLQMQQSIQLLQMNSVELEEFLDQELTENPFLELNQEDPNDSPSEAAPEPVSSNGSSEANSETSINASDDIPDSKPLDDQSNPEHFDDVDVDWKDCFDPFESQAKYRNTLASTDDELQDFTEYTASQDSLNDNLNWQLRVSGLEGEEYKIGHYLINSINENGYLETTCEAVAEELGKPVQLIEDVLEVIQEFEPPGVGARDQIECIRLQLEEMGIRNSLLYKIIEEDFEMLQKRKFKELARKYQVDQSKIQEVFNHVTRCDPKPGRSITNDQVRYITPDVYVKKIDESENGFDGSRYMYFLNEGRAGMLHVSNYYKDLLLNTNGTAKEDKDYAKEKFNSASWLIKNIEKRKSTILKVTEAIMEYQKEFLEKGIEHLRPLTLKEIAEVVEMHESTVARVTSGKYVETPRGVFELKYFFSSQLDTSDGESTSSRSVKNKIREIIDDEDLKKPYSDLKITQMLNDQGIQIARRTVAKYREQLKILPAKLRKER